LVPALATTIEIGSRIPADERGASVRLTSSRGAPDNLVQTRQDGISTFPTRVVVLPRRFKEHAMRRWMSAFCLVVLVGLASAALAIDIEGTSVVIPVVMHGPGALGTQWRTDVWISNMTMARKQVTLTLYPTSGVAVSAEASVPIAGTVWLRDVVLSTFGLANAKGLLMFSVSGPTGIQATARIYNAGNPIGEFGQFTPGIAVDRLERQAFVAGLSGVDGNRANFGIANPLEEPVEVTVHAYDGQGTQLTTRDYTVPGMSVVQVNDLFSGLGIPPQGPVQLDMHVEAAAVPIYGYGSVVRNDTGDAIFIFGTSPNN
jgi:hypothetical protein